MRAPGGRGEAAAATEGKLWKVLNNQPLRCALPTCLVSEQVKLGNFRGIDGGPLPAPL